MRSCYFGVTSRVKTHPSRFAQELDVEDRHKVEIIFQFPRFSCEIVFFPVCPELTYSSPQEQMLFDQTWQNDSHLRSRLANSG